MVRKKVITVYFLIVLGTNSFCSFCGKEGRNPLSYLISGGHRASPHQYPWMVSYSYFDASDTRNVCAGSLISDRLVLTARHCAENADRWETAKVGLHDTEDPNNFVEIHFTEKRYPDHNRENDIAIVALREPVNLRSNKVGVVCLPETDEKEYFGESVRTMGWGMTGFDGKKGTWGRSLKHLNLQVAHERDKILLFTPVRKINGIHQDPCGGDSGAPLVIKKGGRWNVIATLTGGGYDCRTDTVLDEHGGMGVWTKVGPNLRWIKKEMERYGSEKFVNRYKNYYN